MANCAVVNNVEFQIYSANAGVQLTSQGGFSLQAMPAGYYTIRELIPQGYAEPIAFCGFAPTNTQVPAMTEVVTYALSVAAIVITGVVLIQGYRDTAAIHAKLDEIVVALRETRNDVVSLEHEDP